MCHPHLSTQNTAKGDVGDALFGGVVNRETTLVHSDVVDGNTIGMKLLDVNVPGQPRM